MHRLTSSIARDDHPRLSHARSGGAVIIIVLTLLSTMVFLGFFFFGYTDQAHKMAQAYAATEDYEIDTDRIADQAFEQLLIGVRPGFEESALWGNKYSILPHFVGPIDTSLRPLKDAPNSGTGMSLVYWDDDPPGNSNKITYLAMDFDGDGIADDYDGTAGPDFIAYSVDTNSGSTKYIAQGNFRLNFSRVAQFQNRNDAFNKLNGSGTNLPWVTDFDPAVGYTYPDLNSMFLAYDAFHVFRDSSGNPLTPARRVVIPSFFRPQLMLEMRDANARSDGGLPGTDGAYQGAGLGGFANAWLAVGGEGAASLRPHESHINYNGSQRFPNVAFVTQSGNTNRMIPPFPFQNDLNLDGVYNQMGVFSDVTNGFPLYELDFDADNDGVRDSIWMDLGLQLIDLPDGRQLAPLVAFKVVDADALFNINVHGNLAGTYFPTSTSNLDPRTTTTGGLLIDYNGNGTFDYGDIPYPVHRSNQGLSPTEVNIGFGLYGDLANSGLDSNTIQKLLNEYLAANMPLPSYTANTRQTISSAEMLFLLSGRIPYGSSTTVLQGRHGEPIRLLENYGFGDPVSYRRPRAGLTLEAGPPTGPPPPPLSSYPPPPYPLTQWPPAVAWQDADNDHDAPSTGGIGYVAATPTLKYQQPPAVHPLSFTGTGSDYMYYDATPTNKTPNGGVRRMTNGFGALPYSNNPSAWPTYASNVPTYSSGHWTDQGRLMPNPGVAVYGVLPYTSAGPSGNALQTPANNTVAPIDPTDLIDDDSEITAYSEFADSADARFEPSENARLQLPDSDYNLLNESSRLTELAPFNFKASPNAAANRKLFATDSWSRLETTRGAPYTVRSTEFNRWTDPTFDPNMNPGFLTQPGYLPRFNGFYYYDNPLATPPIFERQFPPQFGPSSVGGGPAAEVGAPYTSNIDPYRAELRQLLWTRERAYNLGNTTDTTGRPGYESTRDRVQHRLNINGVLVGFDSNRNPIYRQPVPHPVFATMLPSGQVGALDASVTIQAMYHGQHDIGVTDPPSPYPAFNTIDESTAAGRQAMEWWARYDRQRMARDIYVLLWTLSGGNDNQNYATTTGTATPSPPTRTGFEDDTFNIAAPSGPKRVREMAQFAVNMVDAMDHDNVITRFEYDRDLTNGWQTTGGDMDVVYGVEQQQLAFSEVMFVVQRDNANDLSLTYHKDDDLGGTGAADTNFAHQFLYIELRNTSPFTVPLDDGQWRIVRVPSGMSVGAGDANVKASVEFQGQATSPRTYKSVAPGANFIIGCHDGSVVNGSGTAIGADFYADVDTSGAAGALEAVIPISSTTTMSSSTDAVKPPLVDLDLNSTDTNHSNFINTANSKPYTSPAGGQYSGTRLVGKEAKTTDSALLEFDLVLQRRRNLNSYGKGETAGGSATQLWIEVDRFRIRNVHELQIASNTQAAIQAGFDGTGSSPAQPVASDERRQPFDSRQILNINTTPPAGPSGPATFARKHTLVDKNDPNNYHDARNFADVVPSTPAQTSFTLWQPHFDRPFTSVIDLLSIPLYGFAGNSDATTDAAVRQNNDAYYLGGPTYNLAAALGGSNDAKMVGHRTAAIRFQYPEAQLPGGTNAAPNSLAALQPSDFMHYRNRWYRLLEFVEVPDQAEQAAHARMTWQQRTPGKINLNTLRNEEVLAGLLDDPIGHFSYTPPAALTDDRLDKDLVDTTRPRNWFYELQLARDQPDPFANGLTTPFTVNGTTYTPPIAAPLPGGLNSQPFQSPSFLNHNTNPNVTAPTVLGDLSTAQTILRSRTTSTNGVKQGLFEARTLTDVENTGAPTESKVDYHTKNRLLAKVHNRTTNSSNVFIVWMGIGFFEAHRDTGGYTQIGGQAKDIPVRRAFMVCDMSRIEEAYDDPDPTDNVPGSFDFRKFIIYRKLIK